MDAAKGETQLWQTYRRVSQRRKKRRRNRSRLPGEFLTSSISALVRQTNPPGYLGVLWAGVSHSKMAHAAASIKKVREAENDEREKEKEKERKRQRKISRENRKRKVWANIFTITLPNLIWHISKYFLQDTQLSIPFHCTISICLPYKNFSLFPLVLL